MKFHSVIRALRLVLALLTVAGALCAQTAVKDEPGDPQYFMTVGGGFSQYSDPHYAVSGSFGVRVASGLYSVTSLDMTAKQVTTTATDAKTGKTVNVITRVPLSTVRTGLQKVLARSGPFTLTAAADLGLANGDGSTVAAFSGGGALAYLVPKVPGVFLFGAARIIKSPQPGLDPATVQTAFTFGVGKTF